MAFGTFPSIVSVFFFPHVGHSVGQTSKPRVLAIPIYSPLLASAGLSMLAREGMTEEFRSRAHNYYKQHRRPYVDSE